VLSGRPGSLREGHRDPSRHPRPDSTDNSEQSRAHFPPDAGFRFNRFEEDPQHPGLRFKKVHPSRPIYSARVTLSHRALAIRSSDDWIWFWIGSHADYEDLLIRL